ncbi:MAG TPA: hypothetical protein ENN38_07080 [Actinobacteria bacterium]|nr:hypothetical protein [Actinomycetota bacterium]
MKKLDGYESFPVWIVLLANSLMILIYGLGFYLLSKISIWIGILYLLYCLWVEFMILKRSCIDCYYYDKLCGLGKGKVALLFFKKGDPKKFAEKELVWYTLIPDFMVNIFPIAGGIIILVKDFSWPLLAILAIFIIISFGGTAVIRGQFACKYCKQKEVGCPAAEMFEKKE